MSRIPIQFREHLQLTSLGIQKTSISFATLTLQSDKNICVCESVDGRKEVVIVDLANPSSPVRRPISAESAILHPSQQIIALRLERQLQIFHLELKTKLKSYVMDEDVQFWRWINEHGIGLVTNTAVYHWSLQPDLQPVKIFERHTSMADTQIINYHVNKGEKWFVLVGISSRDGRVAGNMQLYSKERNISQSIEGHAASFATLKTDESASEFKLFVFAVRTVTAAKKIILEPTIFSDNQNLQNLLILTAIKADKTRVMGYINKLKNYDVKDIATIVLENSLYEEGFEIYKRHNNHVEALKVLIEHIVSLDRAAKYAESIDMPELWSILAKGQLDGCRIKDSINSYIKARDPSNYHEVIEASTKTNKYPDLIRYLEMARQTIRETTIDNELLFAYAHTRRIHAIESMLQGANVVDVLSVGNRCYEQGNYPNTPFIVI
ncbi:hypothetical protein PCK1_000979 [Pneumocystis canis]|nr:hypothetical protein PCK1_000979 [Pneumocystis canis]